MADFLPRRDFDLLHWTVNFAQKIQEDPSQLGLTAKQASNYTVLQTDYAVALRAARDNATRGLLTVLEKNESREALIAQTRVLARIVRALPGISEQTLVSLQLRPHSYDDADATNRHPVSAAGTGSAEMAQLRGLPAKGPRATVKADSRRIVVSVRTARGKRKRPSGVVGAAVYWAIGDKAPTSLSGYTLAGNTTKPGLDFILPEDTAPPGTKVWVTTCWLDARLQPGPASTPALARIGFDFLLLAA